MSYGIGLIIESLVAILLLLTILYCARLNKQIEGLKADEKLMKATVGELIVATERAERAIAGLKLTANEAEETLGKRLRDAETYCRSITTSLAAGEDVLGRLRKIAYASSLLGGESTPEPDPQPAPPANDAKAVAAAAQAFAERARARAHGQAA
ncbi:MAG: DUF6468 domain-containing protein [Pseudorhodoplanes sp.]